MHDTCRKLAEVADEQVAKAETVTTAYGNANLVLEEMQRCAALVEDLIDNVAQIAERKSVLDARLKEA